MEKERDVIIHASFMIIVSILFKMIFANDDYDLWLQSASSYVPIGMCVASTIAYGVYLYRAHEKYPKMVLELKSENITKAQYLVNAGIDSLLLCMDLVIIVIIGLSFFGYGFDIITGNVKGMEFLVDFSSFGIFPFVAIVSYLILSKKI